MTVIGREFNLGSPKQLQQILFDELALPKTKRIKTGYTTDADALQALLVQTEHPLLDASVAPPRCLSAEDCCRFADPDGRYVTVAFTPRSTSWWRRPGGCRRPIPTCKTSRSARLKGAASGRRSSSAPASSRS